MGYTINPAPKGPRLRVRPVSQRHMVTRPIPDVGFIGVSGYTGPIGPVGTTGAPALDYWEDLSGQLDSMDRMHQRIQQQDPRDTCEHFQGDLAGSWEASQRKEKELQQKMAHQTYLERVKKSKLRMTLQDNHDRKLCGLFKDGWHILAPTVVEPSFRKTVVTKWPGRSMLVSTRARGTTTTVISEGTFEGVLKFVRMVLKYLKAGGDNAHENNEGGKDSVGAGNVQSKDSGLHAVQKPVEGGQPPDGDGAKRIYL